MLDDIRTLLRLHAQLPVDVDTLRTDSDLYDAGLTSHAFISLMMALEDHFGIEFPERLLRRASFQTIAAIQDAVCQLGPTSAQAV